MRFTKMHGLGNDYVYIDCLARSIDKPAQLAKRISDRNRGVGSDGLILITPSSKADVRMEMYNADGSRGEMCGNGIRCVAKYVVDRSIVSQGVFSIETDAGVRRVWCDIAEGKVDAVRVDMGVASLDPQSLPSTIDLPEIVDYPMNISGRAMRVTCVSVGNPHAVVFVDDLDSIALEDLGLAIENASVFPNRINAHFAAVQDREHVAVKVWERGSGATSACGTGACAVCVAGSVTKRLGNRVTVSLPGGDLVVELAEDGRVYLTGPAVEVFSGDWPD